MVRNLFFAVAEERYKFFWEYIRCLFDLSYVSAVVTIVRNMQ